MQIKENENFEVIQKVSPITTIDPLLHDIPDWQIAQGTSIENWNKNFLLNDTVSEVEIDFTPRVNIIIDILNGNQSLFSAALYKSADDFLNKKIFKTLKIGENLINLSELTQNSYVIGVKIGLNSVHDIFVKRHNIFAETTAVFKLFDEYDESDNFVGFDFDILQRFDYGTNIFNLIFDCQKQEQTKDFPVLTSHTKIWEGFSNLSDIQWPLSYHFLYKSGIVGCFIQSETQFFIYQSTSHIISIPRDQFGKIEIRWDTKKEKLYTIPYICDSEKNKKFQFTYYKTETWKNDYMLQKIYVLWFPTAQKLDDWIKNEGWNDLK